VKLVSGVPVVVAIDEGFQRIRRGGVPAYPWSDTKMAECAVAEKARVAATEKARVERVEKLKARQTNLEFLKSEAGEDTMLVRSKGEKPSVSSDLASLGDDGVVGLYFRCGQMHTFFHSQARSLAHTRAHTNTFSHTLSHSLSRIHTALIGALIAAASHPSSSSATRSSR